MLRKKLIFNKRMVITAIHIGLFVFLTFSNCLGQEKMSFDFENREILKPIKMPDDSISMTATSDNTTISTLFEKFSVNLQTEKDALSGAVFTGFYIPVKAVQGKKYINYIQNLRGVVHKDADARIILSLDLGGKLITIEFPYGENTEADLFRSFPRRVKNGKTNSYLATMSITVERRSVKSIAFIEIDSFDLAIGIMPKQK